MNRREFTLAAAALAAAPCARAGAYPDRPIRLIYNFAPGGPGDAVARHLAAHMGDILNTQIVVHNQSGGAGAVGILAAARAPADGYTLLFAALTGIVQVPFVTGNDGFDPFGSLMPVANAGSSPLAVIVRKDVPAEDFVGFLEWARAQPGGVSVGGAGAIVELTAAVLARASGANLVWVGYRGMAPALQAMLAGDLPVALLSPSAMLSGYLQSGDVKVLAVSSVGPSELFPGAEPIGRHVPGFQQEIDFAFWAPADVPAEIIARLDEAVQQVMQLPVVAGQLRHNGVAPRYLNGSALAEILRREDASIREALLATGVKFGG